MPQVIGIGLPRGRGKRLFRLVARGSNASAATVTAVAAGPLFVNLPSPGVGIPPLQSNQALRLVRYVLSVVDAANSNALFNAQPPIMQLQVNPFGLTNAVMSWSTDEFGGTGVAGQSTMQGLISALGTQFMLTNEWIEYDDYNQSLKTYTSAVIALQNQPLKMISNVRLWNSSAAGQNITLNETVLWEIWQKRLDGDL